MATVMMSDVPSVGLVISQPAMHSKDASKPMPRHMHDVVDIWVRVVRRVNGVSLLPRYTALLKATRHVP